MYRLVLIHWNAAEGEARAQVLRAAGYEVEVAPVDGASLKEIKNDPPAAIVIDLSRLPTQGRDVGMAFRGFKATRHVPLVFAEGEAEKVAKVRAQLPDAVFTDWKRIRGALRKAIAKPPKAPVVPANNLAGYSGTPLPKKLGIKPGTTVALLGAPGDFERTLGPLPEAATLTRVAARKADLSIWFVRSLRELETGVPKMFERASSGPVWIAWTKKAADPSSEVGEADVRARGLGAGLVDYKICAIDGTWSGLLFARRKTKR
jgi:CheY-like chemotaxis protein